MTEENAVSHKELTEEEKEVQNHLRIAQENKMKNIHFDEQYKQVHVQPKEGTHFDPEALAQKL